MKTFKAFAILLLLVMSSTLTVNAQVTDTAQLRQMIDSSNFIFIARSAQAQGGASRILTTDEYDLKLNRNKIVSFLPYYGRAYTLAPGEDGGIKFTSTDFKYSPKKNKKGWRIVILPKDAKDITQLSLDISTSGYATLQVISNNRQNISYYGVIEKGK